MCACVCCCAIGQGQGLNGGFIQGLRLFSKQPLSHLNEQGDPRMVDTSQKQVTTRIARAQARIQLPSATVEAMKTLQNDKGSVLHTAIIGGIMAAKKTPELIPLCHSVPLNKVQIEINMPKEDMIEIECTAKATHTTGVEMEALVGATVASLVVYDMLKASSHGIVIESVRLLEKSGGKQDFAVGKSLL